MDAVRIIEAWVRDQVHTMDQQVRQRFEKVVLPYFIDMDQVQNIHWIQKVERNLYPVLDQ